MKKHIDIKSLLIGIFLTSTVLLAIGATDETDEWDEEQEWKVQAVKMPQPIHAIDWPGYQPFAVKGDKVLIRRRIK